ncbi:MAG: zf-HC2 domain-containing protein [Mycobacterium leprae]
MSAECHADWLSAYLDGELPVESAARVELHLQSCEHCRQWLEQARQANLALVQAVPSASPDLTSRILAALPLAEPSISPAWAYANAAAWGAVAMAGGGVLFLVRAYPALTHFLRTLHSLNAIFWSTGVLHLQDPTEAYRLGGLLLLSVVMLLGAYYGTRLLDSPEEVTQ